MANRNRRFAVAAIALPFLFLAMPGVARAATLPSPTPLIRPAPWPVDGSLREAINSANGESSARRLHGEYQARHICSA